VNLLISNLISNVTFGQEEQILLEKAQETERFGPIGSAPFR